MLGCKQSHTRVDNTAQQLGGPRNLSEPHFFYPQEEGRTRTMLTPQNSCVNARGHGCAVAWPMGMGAQWHMPVGMDAR